MTGIEKQYLFNESFWPIMSRLSGFGFDPEMVMSDGFWNGAKFKNKGKKNHLNRMESLKTCVFIEFIFFQKNHFHSLGSVHCYDYFFEIHNFSQEKQIFNINIIL